MTGLFCGSDSRLAKRAAKHSNSKTNTGGDCLQAHATVCRVINCRGLRENGHRTKHHAHNNHEKQIEFSHLSVLLLRFTS